MADSGTVSLKRPGTWPRRARLAVEAIVTVMTNAYMMARSRAAGSPSKAVSLMAERDDALWRAALSERQFEIFRRRLLNMNPHARPEYLAGDRLLILEIMWLCGWSIVLTAKRFVLHRNNISSWCRRFRGEGNPGPFFGRPPWNKIGESVRWLDHGPQFRNSFEKRVSGPKANVVRCRVHCFKLNGKVERLFRTFKAWARMKLFAWFEDRKRIARWMQRKLDVFRDWYNTARPNQALGGLTPEEAWSETSLPDTTAIRAHEPQPSFEVRRRMYGGDPHLPVLDVEVEWPEAA